jgi:hypothetical protein
MLRDEGLSSGVQLCGKEARALFTFAFYVNNLDEEMSRVLFWWAGPDSDRRPSARQADVLTKLDDRPTVLVYFTLIPDI